MQQAEDARRAAEKLVIDNQAKAESDRKEAEQADIDAEVKAENDRVAAENKAINDAAIAKEEEKKRLADRAHVGQVRGDAKTALMELCNIDEGAAKRAVMAIDKGLVPNVSISY